MADERDPVLTTRGLKHIESTAKENDENQIKKVKNRESAKNSRQRKRVYIKLLEDRFANQEQVIAELKMQLQNSQEGWHPLHNSNKARMVKTLKWATQLGGSSQNIDSSLTALMSEYGPEGTSRADQLQQAFTTIEQELTPAYLQ